MGTTSHTGAAEQTRCNGACGVKLYDAIFLDRDGTINYERADYVTTWTEFVFLPGALDALRKLAELDLPIVVVTNQSAIGRGRVTAQAVDALHNHMRQRIAEAGGRIDAIYVCPHHPDDGCDCRKPKPGLLLKAASDLGLRLDHCLLIGDLATDISAAKAVDCSAILVSSGLSGSRQGALDRQSGAAYSTVVSDLSAAVEVVLSACRHVAFTDRLTNQELQLSHSGK
jgi:D-glycero-D-manno-heptose 1,7-bisphosphate phosphatase